MLFERPLPAAGGGAGLAARSRVLVWRRGLRSPADLRVAPVSIARTFGPAQSEPHGHPYVGTPVARRLGATVSGADLPQFRPRCISLSSGHPRRRVRTQSRMAGGPETHVVCLRHGLGTSIALLPGTGRIGGGRRRHPLGAGRASNDRPPPPQSSPTKLLPLPR